MTDRSTACDPRWGIATPSSARSARAAWRRSTCAKDLKHERTVAIKVLRPELSASLGADRFLREIRVAANLQHPNILGLYDSGEAEGLLYYVMPFVEGESLRDRLNREQQLPLHDALQITREAAEALQYAHERGIVHRDIKPENILLLGGHALVADFGIARAVSQAGGEKLTQTGMAVGTPHYMSPEQSLGSEHVDARSDVYSLGCVLYELLIGQPPFTGPERDGHHGPALDGGGAEPAGGARVGPGRGRGRGHAGAGEDAGRPVPDDEGVRRAAVARRRPRRRWRGRRSGGHPRRRGGRPAGRTARRPGRLRGGRRRRSRRRRPSGAGSSSGRMVGGRRSCCWRRRRLRRVEVHPSRRRGGAAAGRGRGARSRPTSPCSTSSSGAARIPLGYLADGLTEALIHELSGVDGLQVISQQRRAALQEGRRRRSLKIAQALNVGTLVQGDVAESGDRSRQRLADPGRDRHEIGSKTLERPRGELFALQDDLSKEVSVFLRQQVGKEVQLRETRATTRNVEAWTLYQRAEAEARDADALAATGDTAGAAPSCSSGPTPSWRRRRRRIRPGPRRRCCAAGSIYRQSRIFESADPDHHSRDRTGLEHADRALGLKADDPDALELRGTLRYWKWLNNLGGIPGREREAVCRCGEGPARRRSTRTRRRPPRGPR